MLEAQPGVDADKAQTARVLNIVYKALLRLFFCKPYIGLQRLLVNA